MSGITQSTALWYASRATGVVCLVLLTVVVLLGILVNRQGRLPGLPKFAVTGLHRSISLLAVIFLAIHVITAVADKYVTIQLIAAVVPFTSGYLPFQLGLGAVALDLIAALIITSLLRARLGRRLWRGMHWLAYAAYPVALLHSWTSAKDPRSGGLLVLFAVCVLSVGAAAGYRLAAARTGRRAARPGVPPGTGGYRTAAAPGRPPAGGQAGAAAGRRAAPRARATRMAHVTRKRRTAWPAPAIPEARSSRAGQADDRHGPDGLPADRRGHGPRRPSPAAARRGDEPGRARACARPVAVPRCRARADRRRSGPPG